MISFTTRNVHGRTRLSRRLLLLASAMAVATASLVVGTGDEADAAPTGQPLGIDVASHQHPGGQPIDWKAVRKYGVRWAVIKADEGPTSSRPYYTNPYFKQDWNASIANGIATGAYHYARPRLPVWTAALDARHFAATVGSGLGGAGLPPVLDLEESGGLSPANLAAWTQTFLTEIQRLTGRQPMIYTALWYWNSYMGATEQFAQYPLWLASYASAPGLMPGGWSGWNFWQYTGHGRVPGVPAEVDVNVSCGTGKYLAGFCPATRYSTWATKYYNQRWQERQQSSANAVGSATKKVTTPTTKAKTGTTKAATKTKTTTPTTKAPTTKKATSSGTSSGQAKTTPTTKKATTSASSTKTKTTTKTKAK